MKINIGSQRMHVFVDGKLRHVWKVSTGTRRHRTPRGSYRPKRLERSWYSRKYYNSPMPHSIFFRGGYAIHGTHAVRRLGRPASHGCVRLQISNARELFKMVSVFIENSQLDGAHAVNDLIYIYGMCEK